MTRRGRCSGVDGNFSLDEGELENSVASATSDSEASPTALVVVSGGGG